MKMIFEKWSCLNILDKQKREIEANIRKEISRVKDRFSYIPKTLTISIFERPKTRILECTGVGDNKYNIVTYIYPLSGEATTFKFL